MAVSEQAIEFLEEWISEKVRPRPAAIDAEKQAEILATKCQADAARAGVPIEEIVEEVGDLEDLIVAKLEDAAMPDVAAQPTPTTIAIAAGCNDAPLLGSLAVDRMSRRQARRSLRQYRHTADAPIGLGGGAVAFDAGQPYR